MIWITFEDLWNKQSLFQLEDFKKIFLISADNNMQRILDHFPEKIQADILSVTPDTTGDPRDSSEKPKETKKAGVKDQLSSGDFMSQLMRLTKGNRFNRPGARGINN